jgi:hypothetical protein
MALTPSNMLPLAFSLPDTVDTSANQRATFLTDRHSVRGALFNHLASVRHCPM